MVVYFYEGFSDVSEVDVTIANVSEAVCLTREAFDVEFVDTFSEVANPVCGVTVFPVVTDVELKSNEWGVELIDVFCELFCCLVGVAFVVVAEVVPDVFYDDVDTEFGREGDSLFYVIG